MCKYTYHHYPSCGHIANWTLDSCIGFTSSLRLMRAGHIMVCKESETTHDLLPVTHFTACFQCDRETQKEIEEHGYLQHAARVGRHVSIEGLMSSAPIVDVQVTSSLGTEEADQEGQQGPESQESQEIQDPPIKVEGSEEDAQTPGTSITIPTFKDNTPSHLASGRPGSPTLGSLPPPRILHGTQQKKSFKKTCRPRPPQINILPARAYNPDSPTPKPNTARTSKTRYTSPSPQHNLPSEESPVVPAHEIYNWIPLPDADTVPHGLPAPYPISGSIYSRDRRAPMASSSYPITASSPCSRLPRPQEYQRYSYGPPPSSGEMRPRPLSFRNDQGGAFPGWFRGSGASRYW